MWYIVILEVSVDIQSLSSLKHCIYALLWDFLKSTDVIEKNFWFLAVTLTFGIPLYMRQGIMSGYVIKHQYLVLQLQQQILLLLVVVVVVLVVVEVVVVILLVAI